MEIEVLVYKLPSDQVPEDRIYKKGELVEYNNIGARETKRCEMVYISLGSRNSIHWVAQMLYMIPVDPALAVPKEKDWALELKMEDGKEIPVRVFNVEKIDENGVFYDRDSNCVLCKKIVATNNKDILQDGIKKLDKHFLKLYADKFCSQETIEKTKIEV